MTRLALLSFTSYPEVTNKIYYDPFHTVDQGTRAISETLGTFVSVSQKLALIESPRSLFNDRQFWGELNGVYFPSYVSVHIVQDSKNRNLMVILCSNNFHWYIFL
jgi:hypothetical protein